jgi:hypothetical protein
MPSFSPISWIGRLSASRAISMSDLTLMALTPRLGISTELWKKLIRKLLLATYLNAKAADTRVNLFSSTGNPVRFIFV